MAELKRAFGDALNAKREADQPTNARALKAQHRD